MEAFIESWREWGVFISLLITVGIVSYLFTRRSEDTGLLIYKVVSVMALVLSVPAILTNPLLNIGLFDELTPTALEALVWLNVVAGAVSLLLFGLALFSVRSVDSQRTEYIPPTYSPSPMPHRPMHGVDPNYPNVSGEWNAETELAPMAQPVSIVPTQVEANDTVLLRRDSRSEYFAWLVELAGPRAGTTYPIGRERTVVGRSADSDIRLEDNSISSQHAALLRDKETQSFILHDLASSNGTLLREERIISPYPLRDGDIITVGRSKLYFMEIRPEEVGTDSTLSDQRRKGEDQIFSQAEAPAITVPPGEVEAESVLNVAEETE